MDLPSVALVGAAALDLYSTELVLSRGGRELNPVMREPAARIVMKTAATTAVLYTSHRLSCSGHPGWAKGLKWGTAIAWGAAAAWNFNQLRRTP